MSSSDPSRTIWALGCHQQPSMCISVVPRLLLHSRHRPYTGSNSCGPPHCLGKGATVIPILQMGNWSSQRWCGIWMPKHTLSVRYCVGHHGTQRNVSPVCSPAAPPCIRPPSSVDLGQAKCVPHLLYSWNPPKQRQSRLRCNPSEIVFHWK